MTPKAGEICNMKVLPICNFSKKFTYPLYIKREALQHLL